jgi:hypothetical protein
MPRGVPFTDDEYVLCTYAALYGAEDLGGVAAMNLNSHPGSSIKDKVRNIAADLDGKKIKRCPAWSVLTGTTTGSGPRYTAWNKVEPLTRLSQEDLLRRCRNILSHHLR